MPLVLSLICLRALLRDGYLLQVDIVFGPRPGPVLPGFGAPVSWLQAAAVDVLGGEATGKIYAIGALFLAGFAPMILFRRASWYAQCAAGFLGALNPWVYDRMVEGQWGSRGRRRRSLPLARGLGSAAGAPEPDSRGSAGGVCRGHRGLRSPCCRLRGGPHDRCGRVAAAVA